MNDCVNEKARLTDQLDGHESLSYPPLLPQWYQGVKCAFVMLVINAHEMSHVTPACVIL